MYFHWLMQIPIVFIVNIAINNLHAMSACMSFYIPCTISRKLFTSLYDYHVNVFPFTLTIQHQVLLSDWMDFILGAPNPTRYGNVTMCVLNVLIYAHFNKNTNTPAHSCYYPLSQSFRHEPKASVNVHVKYHNQKKNNLFDRGRDSWSPEIFTHDGLELRRMALKEKHHHLTGSLP